MLKKIKFIFIFLCKHMAIFILHTQECKHMAIFILFLAILLFFVPAQKTIISLKIK